jgi:hypothetical protein
MEEYVPQSPDHSPPSMDQPSFSEFCFEEGRAPKKMRRLAAAYVSRRLQKLNKRRH